MKTITEIKQHFSDEEIKLLIEIIKGKQDFSVMEDSIKDFYADDLNPDEKYSSLLKEDRDKIWQSDLLEKLEFDFEYGGLI